MKAKEYAKEYKTRVQYKLQCNYSQEDAERFAISEVLIGLSNELADLTKTRGKYSFEAAISCFDEIEKKWRAFTYLVNGWKPEGFTLFIQHRHPDLWQLYELAKTSIEMYKIQNHYKG